MALLPNDVDEIMYYWTNLHKNTAEIAKLTFRTEPVVDRIVHEVLNRQRRSGFLQTQ